MFRDGLKRLISSTFIIIIIISVYYLNIFVFFIRSYVEYWARQGHVEYLILGMRPSDDNASLLPVFKGCFRLLCHSNVFRIVNLSKN